MPLTECWEKRIPSINSDALSKLEKVVNSKSKVFEFGTGGSTVWLAKIVKELISVEYNKDWFRILKEGMMIDFGKIPENVTLLLRSNTPVLNDIWIISPTTGEPISLNFTDSILVYPDNYFDLIIVDGRARMRCLFNARPKVKSGGFILLDDSQRSEYQEATDMMKGWESMIYNSGKDTKFQGSQSTFFKKPKNANRRKRG